MASKRHKGATETELKIKMSREDLEAVFEHYSKKDYAGKISHKYLPRAYYDTENIEMHEAGLSLRVQYKAGKEGKVGTYEQTIKFEAVKAKDDTKDVEKPVEGVLIRHECKDQIEGPKPDMEEIGDDLADEAMEPFKNKSLKHIFTAAIERRYFILKIDDKQKSEIELAFDVGDIILQPDGDHHPFVEVEIEIKSGSSGAINTVKDKILKLAPTAEIQPLSKSQQGTLLYKKSHNL